MNQHVKQLNRSKSIDLIDLKCQQITKYQLINNQLNLIH